MKVQTDISDNRCAERYASSCGTSELARVVTRLSARLDVMTCQMEAQRRVIDKMREVHPPDSETAVDESRDDGGDDGSEDGKNCRLKRAQSAVTDTHTEFKEWWSSLEY